MTTATSAFTWDNASTTTAKVWINGVNDLLIAAGLVRTTDTGQLDPTTISSIPAANASFGYHVYKFPDTLQATTPILIRISYEVDGGNSRTRIGATVGSSSNGAGTISTPSLIYAPASMTNTFQAGITSYACYVDGTFTMVLGYAYKAAGDDNNSVAALVVDRARDATGTALAGGFLAESLTDPLYAGTGQSRSLYGGASPAVGSNFMPSLVPSKTAVSSAAGADVNVFRHYMMVPGVKPSLGCLTYFNAEFGALTPFSCTVLGSTHTYLPMGRAMTHWSAVGVRDHSCAIRWE